MIENTIQENNINLQKLNPTDAQEVINNLLCNFIAQPKNHLWEELKHLPSAIGNPSKDVVLRISFTIPSKKELFLIFRDGNNELTVYKGLLSDIVDLMRIEKPKELYMLSTDFNELWCVTEENDLLNVNLKINPLKTVVESL